MTGLSYSEYMEQSFPEVAAAAHPQYGAVYMSSLSLSQQMPSDDLAGTFFDPEALSVLSDEGFSAFAADASGAIGQLNRDIESYGPQFLATDNVDGAAAYVEQYADFMGTLAMGAMGTEFAVEDGLSGAETQEKIVMAIEDFTARYEQAYEATVEIRAELDGLSQGIIENGAQFIAENQEQISDLSADQQAFVRGQVSEAIDDMEANGDLGASVMRDQIDAVLDSVMGPVAPVDTGGGVVPDVTIAPPVAPLQ